MQIIPILFDVFLDILRMWSFQFNCESIRTPRYFILFVCSIYLLLMCREMLFVRCFCAVWNKTNLVLSVFSDNLLAQSHSCTLQSSLLIVNSSDCKFLWEWDKFESSAKRWRSRTEDALLKSFMYNRKRRGPSTDPWGTPQVTDFCSDAIIPIVTNCRFRFIK